MSRFKFVYHMQHSCYTTDRDATDVLGTVGTLFASRREDESYHHGMSWSFALRTCLKLDWDEAYGDAKLSKFLISLSSLPVKAPQKFDHDHDDATFLLLCLWNGTLTVQRAAMAYAIVELVSAMIVASYRGHTHTVNMLIDSGKVRIDHYDSMSRTALLFAYISGQIDVMRLLVERGAGPDDIAQSGQCIPMHVVGSRLSGTTQIHILEFLISCLSDSMLLIKHKDDNGMDPLQYARTINNRQVVSWITDRMP